MNVKENINMKQSMDKKSLGNRMKEYEKAWSISLPKRMPIIIRLDGQAFHTLCRRFSKPFDLSFIRWMDYAAMMLCKKIQGVEMAYVQSDEISLLVHYYKTIDSEPWFNNNIQKIVSSSAAIASVAFSSYLQEETTFDSRVFVVPEHEVCNYFIWRQQDWERNSISMLAQSLYSHKELHGKNCSVMQDMIFEKGKNWDKLPLYLKRGRCIVKNNEGHWILDDTIPIFTQDRNYIEKFLEIKND